MNWTMLAERRYTLPFQFIYSSGHQPFLAKDHNLCLGDRQDLPIEALREKDCPDSRLYLQLNFLFSLIVIEWN